MGCARTIWNAKVAEEKYYRTFARKYHPIGTYTNYIN
jgi:putative transposase